MNNQIPFIYPFQPIYHPQINQSDFDKLLTKLEKMENEINLLNKRVSLLEKQEETFEDNHDMHFV